MDDVGEVWGEWVGETENYNINNTGISSSSRPTSLDYRRQTRENKCVVCRFETPLHLSATECRHAKRRHSPSKAKTKAWTNTANRGTSRPIQPAPWHHALRPASTNNKNTQYISGNLKKKWTHWEKETTKYLIHTYMTYISYFIRTGPRILD